MFWWCVRREYTDCGQCEWMTMKRLAKSFVHACVCVSDSHEKQKHTEWDLYTFTSIRNNVFCTVATTCTLFLSFSIIFIAAYVHATAKFCILHTPRYIYKAYSTYTRRGLLFAWPISSSSSNSQACLFNQDFDIFMGFNRIYNNNTFFCLVEEQIGCLKVKSSLTKQGSEEQKGI